MAKQLILHIGHPKTGTTVLQKTMQASREALLDCGILHPDSGSHYNHKNLLPYISGGALIMKDLKPYKQSLKKWAAVLSDIERLAPSAVILSSEQLFRGLGLNDIEILGQHLRPVAKKIIISAYLREPSSFALSMVQQQMRSQKPHFSLPSRSYYRERLEPFMAANLGPVKVRVYDRKSLQGGDIVTDFFAQHLPNFDCQRLNHCNSANESMSAEAMAVIQEIQRGQHGSLKRVSSFSVEQIDRQLPGFTRPLMHDHVRHAVHRHCDDLGWLNDQFHIVFPGMSHNVMPLVEAQKICNALDTIDSICAVDPYRKDELLRRLQENRNILTRIVRSIRRRN